MSEMIDLHGHIQRHDMLAHMVLQTSDKEKVAELTKQKNYDIKNVEFEISLNGVVVSRSDLISFMEGMCHHRLQYMCDAIGYNEFKAGVNARQAQVEAVAELKKKEILESEVRKHVLSSGALDFSQAVSRLMNALTQIQDDAETVVEKMYDDSRYLSLLKECREALSGNCSDESKATLIAKLNEI